jgi:hypothetical protein
MMMRSTFALAASQWQHGLHGRFGSAMSFYQWTRREQYVRLHRLPAFGYAAVSTDAS